MKNFIRKGIAFALIFALALGFSSSIQLTSVKEANAATTDPYKARFMELWEELHNPANGYFSPEGIPYHSIETMIVEAPDYGHVTTSEAMSYYLWLEAMYGKFTGDFSYFDTAWETIETYMIPTELDQPNTSMSRYNPTSPATYAPEWEDPSMYPAVLDFNAAVGVDPIFNELKNAYGTSTIYGMHWLLDVDNWYGYGRRADGISTPSYINTFQRGSEESTWETIPQPCWDDMSMGGPNGYLDLFTGDSAYSQQFKYTNAPDADARAVQATYWANEWAKEYGVDISDNVDRASKMGDYLRYSMFDKYFRKIGDSDQAGSGYDAAHYLMSWYYAWGGGITADWAWIIGSSHNHFGYQNPMAAWILSTKAEFKPASQNGARDWDESLDRQLEFYQWLQSAEGGIAGGASNSHNGRYENLPSGTSTFYGMGYEANPVYLDPGSNTWFGFQAWSMQRIAEYYYETKDSRAESLITKWVDWVKDVVILNADGTFGVPNDIDWTGQPDTWTGSYTGNPNLHVTVVNYGTDLGVTGSLANTLLYYAKASGDDEARLLAQELLDRMWNLYRDDKGVAAPERRGDYARFFEQEVFVPDGWSGTMPNGDVIESGITFLDIRSKYLDDPDYAKLEAAYNANEDPEFVYHRFWAQCDVAIANGVYSILFEESGEEPVNNSVITPTSANFDKNIENQDDISVSLILNGNTLEGIRLGNTLLVEGQDYQVNGDLVIINAEFLANQNLGQISLVFEFSAGLDRVLLVTIVDTSDEPEEPTPTPTPIPDPDTDFSLTLANSYNVEPQSNTISNNITVEHNGGDDMDLSKFSIRYYYTKEGTASESFYCDHASMQLNIAPYYLPYTNIVQGNFVTMTNPKTDANSYLEITFNTNDAFVEGSIFSINTRMYKNDWSNYDQTNDYSYGNATRLTVYYDNELILGIEP